MLGLFAAVIGAGVVGCGGGAQDYDLVIISPHDSKIWDEFTAAFGKVFEKAKGRKPRISWRDMGGGAETQVKAIYDQFAKRPAGIDADIFFGGGVDPYRDLASKGYLQPCKIGNLDAIPKDILGIPLYDAEYRWYGSALSSFGILYHKKGLRKLDVPDPKTWEDMTDPKLIGLVGMADPTQSSSARVIYEVILQGYGWDKGMQVITCMSANARDFYSGSSGVVQDVRLGQTLEAPSIDYYAWTQMAQSGEDVLGFVLPENLTVITPDAIGILKGAPHLETARMFLDFVMSEDGQKLWMLKAGAPGGPEKHSLLRSSILPFMYEKYASVSTVKVNPFEFKGALRLDAEKAAARRLLLADLMKSMMMQPQPELRECWRAAVATGDPKKYIAAMTKPPITEEEGLNLARTKWTDEVFRAQKTTEWVQFAVRKYKTVQAEAGKAAAK
jgi:ABC-type Fe3+ transport system substrate-binding protein